VKLVVHLDGKTFKSGQRISGRVYLNINTVSVNARAIQLEFQGNEAAYIVKDDASNDRRTHHSANHTLISTTFQLASFPNGRITRGQYEYPFEWVLPAHLPSSMMCNKISDSRCEIKYFLKATLQSPSGFFSSSAADSSVPVTIAATTTVPESPIRLDPEVVPIRSCCSNKGMIELGMDTTTNAAIPGSVVGIGMEGRNESVMEVSHLRVTWRETVTWWTQDGNRETWTQALCDRKIPVNSVPSWIPNQHVHRQRNYNSLKELCRITTELHIPEHARDTYSGSILEVGHSLTVRAVTPAFCCITSPECYTLVSIQRDESVAPAATYYSEVAPTAPVPSAYSEMVLPPDWSPVEAEVVVLPSSSEYNGTAPVATARAIPMDEESAYPVAAAVASAPSEDESELAPSSAPTSSSASYASVAASAPPSEDDAEDSRAFDPQQVCTVQDLQSLLKQNRNQRALTVMNTCDGNKVLQDSVRRMGPPEFVATLECVMDVDKAALGKVLAEWMGSYFTCRHVLNVVWSLPSPSIRLDVVVAIAPFASDLMERRSMIEQELDPKELSTFRKCMKSSSG